MNVEGCVADSQFYVRLHITPHTLLISTETSLWMDAFPAFSLLRDNKCGVNNAGAGAAYIKHISAEFKWENSTIHVKREACFERSSQFAFSDT